MLEKAKKDFVNIIILPKNNHIYICISDYYKLFYLYQNG